MFGQRPAAEPGTLDFASAIALTPSAAFSTSGSVNSLGSFGSFIRARYRLRFFFHSLASINMLSRAR
jgi:hypothetical protein